MTTASIMILLQYTLVFASVLVMVALGGMFSERSGVINLGLEGLMVFGALAGSLVMRSMPIDAPKIVVILAALGAAAAAGMIGSLLIGVSAVYFKADQTLIGTAVNMLAVAAASVMVAAMNNKASGGTDLSSEVKYSAAQDKFEFMIGDLKLTWFVVIAVVFLIIAIVFFYKTKFALRLRACGEHPQAAGSVGINVYKMRMSGVLISGFLAGIGGIIYIAAVNESWDFKNGVAGAGFLALAVMIFGQWKPQHIAWAALLFGFFRSLSNVYSGFDFLSSLKIPGTVYNMFPYIVSLVVLALTSKHSRAPKAEGIPYDKAMR